MRTRIITAAAILGTGTLTVALAVVHFAGMALAAAPAATWMRG